MVAKPENVVLRHAVPVKTLPLLTFRQILDASEFTLHIASLPEIDNENIKYLISSNGHRIHSLSHLQSLFCANAPQLASYILFGGTKFSRKKGKNTKNRAQFILTFPRYELRCTIFAYLPIYVR